MAYLQQHQELERRFPNYRYIPLTTREPENLDPNHPHFVGKRYVQDLFQDWFERADADRPFDPQNTDVYLCGNPVMIGAPHPTQHPKVYPTPMGMVEFLERNGFCLDHPRSPGNIHIEKYW